MKKNNAIPRIKIMSLFKAVILFYKHYMVHQPVLHYIQLIQIIYYLTLKPYPFHLVKSSVKVKAIGVMGAWRFVPNYPKDKVHGLRFGCFRRIIYMALGLRQARLILWKRLIWAQYPMRCLTQQSHNHFTL